MADGAFVGEEFAGAPTIVGSLARYIGETVTIFTTSGGISGSGFTGVLLAVTPNHVKLITQIAAPPACPLGSACTGPIGLGGYGAGYGRGFGYGAGYGAGFGGYGGYGTAFGGGGAYGWLGSVTEIPVALIASFTHNAI